MKAVCRTHIFTFSSVLLRFMIILFNLFHTVSLYYIIYSVFIQNFYTVSSSLIFFKPPANHTDERSQILKPVIRQPFFFHFFFLLFHIFLITFKLNQTKSMKITQIVLFVKATLCNWSSLIASCRSALLLYCFPPSYIFIFTIDHRVLIGFKMMT